MTPQSQPRQGEPPVECPNGICDRLQIAEWDVQTLITERDAAIAAALMDERQRTVERILHAANLLDPDEVSRTAVTLEKMAMVLVSEGEW